MSVTLQPHSRHSSAKGKAEPGQLRKGIFWDQHANQYATRIGYRLDESTGERVRAHVQGLGTDPDGNYCCACSTAARRGGSRSRWDRVGEGVRRGLPEIPDYRRAVRTRTAR